MSVACLPVPSQRSPRGAKCVLKWMVVRKCRAECHRGDLSAVLLRGAQEMPLGGDGGGEWKEKKDETEGRVGVGCYRGDF